MYKFLLLLYFLILIKNNEIITWNCNNHFSSWNNKDSWSPREIPSKNDIVIIPSNSSCVPIIDKIVNIHSIYINNIYGILIQNTTFKSIYLYNNGTINSNNAEITIDNVFMNENSSILANGIINTKKLLIDDSSSFIQLFKNTKLNTILVNTAGNILIENECIINQIENNSTLYLKLPDAKISSLSFNMYGKLLIDYSDWYKSNFQKEIFFCLDHCSSFHFNFTKIELIQSMNIKPFLKIFKNVVVIVIP